MVICDWLLGSAASSDVKPQDVKGVTLLLGRLSELGLSWLDWLLLLSWFFVIVIQQ